MSLGKHRFYKISEFLIFSQDFAKKIFSDCQILDKVTMTKKIEIWIFKLLHESLKSRKNIFSNNAWHNI